MDYWGLISLAELRVLTTDSLQEVNRAYRKALTASRRNQFFMQSSLGQLEMLRLLDLRPGFVQAGIQILNGEMERIRREKGLNGSQPRKAKKKKEQRSVFLFTGYMFDHPGKQQTQLPAEKEGQLRAAINGTLDRLGAEEHDLAITTGMDAGSELVFVECCTERGMFVQAYFAESKSAYMRDFIYPAGEDWTDRFTRMRNHPAVDEYFQPCAPAATKLADLLRVRRAPGALLRAMALSRPERGLAHLAAGRANIYQAALSTDDHARSLALEAAATELDHAVHGLRHTGMLVYVPLGLLARAECSFLLGRIPVMRRDLEEAQQIATRGPMWLCLADVHLHRARFFRDRAELKAARALIEKYGYGRRKGELEYAEALSSKW